MRSLVFAILVVVLTAGTSEAQGLFDKLQQRGKEALEAIDSANEPERWKDKVRSPGKETGHEPGPGQPDGGAEIAVIKSASDLHGRWRGTVQPPGTGYNMYVMGVDIVITPDFGSMRASASANRCLAELKPAGKLGEYEATFMDASNFCGTRASVSFKDGGVVTVDWVDMPNLEAGDRTYKGGLDRIRSPYGRSWGISEEQRSAFDVVGFRLGMTCEESLAYLESDHSDLEMQLGMVRDNGTASIVSKLTQKGAKKMGSDVFGEQLTLYFESLTGEEMEVEQDPEVLAQIEERKRIIAKRSEMTAQQNRSRRRSGDAGKTDLPEVPEMPRLRPSGAEAELVIITRRLTFGSRQGPHQDNVIKAMTEKYGNPSIHAKDLSSLGGKHRMVWAFDKTNKRIADATGGVCDHLKMNVSKHNEQARYFSTGGDDRNIQPDNDIAGMRPDGQGGGQRGRERLCLAAKHDGVRPAAAARR